MSNRPVSAVALLAWRFVLSKTSDGFLSFIALVSVVGIALGVLALVVVTSVINGFESELTRVITGMNGDVVLYTRGDPIRDPDLVENKIRKIVPETQAIAQGFVTELMASGPTGVAGAVVEGVNPESIGRVTSIPNRVIQGKLPDEVLPLPTEPGVPPEAEIALGYALAERIGATVGSNVRLIIPYFNEVQDSSAPPSPGSGSNAPQVIQGHVVGLVKMGMYEYDSKFVFVPLESVQNILNQQGKVTSFFLKLKPGADTRKASDRLADAFGYPFRSKDWAQMNKNLFYAIQLEKAVIAIILTVIVIVAAFNVVSTLMMVIHDKIKEISILKAMGFLPMQGFRLFCFIGLGMGLLGTVSGVILGMGVNWVLARTRLIDLPPDIYYINFLPVVIRWREVGLIALVSMLISFLATLYPGWKVARRSPLDGIRYE